MGTVKKEILEFLENRNFNEVGQRILLNELLYDTSKDMTEIFSKPENNHTSYQNNLVVTEEKYNKLKDNVADIISIETIDGIKLDNWVGAFIEQAKEIKEPRYSNNLDNKHKMLCLSIEKIRADILHISG